MIKLKKLDAYFDNARVKGKAQEKREVRPVEKTKGIELYQPDPWPEAVDGAEVLTDIAEKLQQHMAMREAYTYAGTLWCAHAHCFEQFTHSPLIAISAPAPECGKSVLLSLLGALVPRPQSTDNMSPAPFFRLAASHKPTFLIDEVDAWFKEDSQLPSAINASFEKYGGGVLRCVGDSHEVQSFDTFTPVAVCGINVTKRLPPATVSRSIVIELDRALPGEVEIPYDQRKHRGELEVLSRKLARWISDNDFRNCDPTLPAGVMNRQADKWRPLFAIAEAAGGLWPEWAKRSLMSMPAVARATRETELLADISKVLRIYGSVYREVIFSRELARALSELDESLWADYNFRKHLPEERCIQPRQLASLLGDFHLSPRELRREDEKKRGYRRKDLEAVIARYLPDGS
jgi:putative DNA primase/helicase